jgi:hypothetical protein
MLPMAEPSLPKEPRLVHRSRLLLESGLPQSDEFSGLRKAFCDEVRTFAAYDKQPPDRNVLVDSIFRRDAARTSLARDETCRIDPAFLTHPRFRICQCNLGIWANISSMIFEVTSISLYESGNGPLPAIDS